MGKDTLRVWERRYGFPVPGRDAQGERLYTPDDVERLQLIRRLMLQGHRPGQLVPLLPGQLRALLAEAPGAPGAGVGAAQPTEAALALVAAADLPGLRLYLAQGVARAGLSAWVQTQLAPLIEQVGLAWAQGRVGIHQEHLFSEVVQDVLRQALRSVPAAALVARPRVLLSTLPGEAHGLGLLMAEALLALEGAACISLGTQTPQDALLEAVRVHEVDIVALSATACGSERALRQALGSLRARLPAEVALWVGGAAARLRLPWPDGCQRVPELASISVAVRRWRERAA